MKTLEMVDAWPVDHGAVAFGRVDADPGGVTATGPTDRPFPWASVTKPATALALLVAVEEGTVALDEPAGPPGSTVRHLLAHASGMAPEPGPPLAPPGKRRIYSNAAFGVLGELIAERSGMPFGEYLAQGVLEPLGMEGTTLSESGPAAPAAAGLVGPLVELVALGHELATPTLISVETLHEAITPQFAELGGVLPGFGRFDPCPWGLGLEVRGNKQPHWTGRNNTPQTYGHFGQSGSFLWIDPVARLFCCGLGDRPFGLWARRSWPALADAVLAQAV